MRAQQGFSYLLLLWWVAVSSVSVLAAGTAWTLNSRRDREAELAFRGQQIAQALRSYHDQGPGGVQAWPTSLDQLLEDRRGPQVKRHLRQRWPDPITGSPQWGLVRQGPFIVGVYSLSERTPLRAEGQHKRYQDWRFMAAAAQAAGAASVPAGPAPAAQAPSLVSPTAMPDPVEPDPPLSP